MRSISSVTELPYRRRSGAVISFTASQTLAVYGNDLGDPHVDISAVNKGRAACVDTR